MAPEPTTVDGLVDDLDAEHASLDALVAGLDEDGWALPTPAAGWAVRDQLSHLAFFDEAAVSAIGDPGTFREAADAALAAGGDPMAPHLKRGRAMAGAEVLAWWRAARAGLSAATRTLGPTQRVPWFGPDMGALSFVSARLMETWAHGQDVADATGMSRPPTARLRHIAHLGVKARPFSYAVRGLEAPTAPVVVQLAGPGGETWSWDDDGGTTAGAGATDTVRGPALDFCLVVTQRRHVLDTALVVEGPVAHQWMSIAQAFAGPPGPGRPPR